MEKKLTISKAFTLAEVLITIAILSLTLSFGFFNIFSFKSQRNFLNDVNLVYEMLFTAQTKALQQEGGSDWGFYLSNSASGGGVGFLAVFKGQSFSSSSVVAAGKLSADTVVSTPASGSTLTVSFARKTGAAASSSIVLSRRTGVGRYRINVSSIGKIEKIKEQ